MYKKVILICSFVCLCISIQSIAQSVKTNLYVTAKSCDYLQDRVCGGPHIVEITQEFVLEQFSTDTLFLKLDKPNWTQSFAYRQLYPKLTVEIISKNEKQSVESNFNGFTLSVPLPTSSCTVKLNYFYNSDSETRFPSGYYLWACEYSKHSWYFSSSDMQIEKAEFYNSDDSLIYLFVNAPSFRQNGKIILDMESMGNRNINFFLVHRPFVHKTTCILYADTINIYLDKGEITTPNPKGSINNNTVLPGNRVTQALVDTSKTIIEQTFKKINTIFPTLQGAVIDIFDADLSAGNYAWGTASSDIKNNHHMVLIDTSMWHDHFLTHELIHLYNNVPLIENDSTYYFFSESVTEYLAVYIHYGDKRVRDLVFNQKIIKFARGQNEDYSIFKLSLNSWERNTSLVVYDKTPFIIHTLAQMVGEDKFHAALKQFYAKVAKGMEINLPNFEQTLKENEVTDSQWNWFIRNL